MLKLTSSLFTVVNASSLSTSPCWSPRDTHGILGMMKPWQMGTLTFRAHLPYSSHRLVRQRIIIN